MAPSVSPGVRSAKPGSSAPSAPPPGPPLRPTAAPCRSSSAYGRPYGRGTGWSAPRKEMGRWESFEKLPMYLGKGEGKTIGCWMIFGLDGKKCENWTDRKWESMEEFQWNVSFNLLLFWWSSRSFPETNYKTGFVNVYNFIRVVMGTLSQESFCLTRSGCSWSRMKVDDWPLENTDVRLPA